MARLWLSEIDRSNGFVMTGDWRWTKESTTKKEHIEHIVRRMNIGHVFHQYTVHISAYIIQSLYLMWKEFVGSNVKCPTQLLEVDFCVLASSASQPATDQGFMAMGMSNAKPAMSKKPHTVTSTVKGQSQSPWSHPKRRQGVNWCRKHGEDGKDIYGWPQRCSFEL